MNKVYERDMNMPYKRQSEPIRKYYTRKNITDARVKSDEKATPRKKMSFEKKLLIQGIVSAVLLIYSIGVSKIDAMVTQRQFIHKAVNINATAADAKYALNKVKSVAKRSTSLVKEGMDYIERLSKGDTDKEDNNAVTALAMTKDGEQDNASVQQEENDAKEDNTQPQAEQGFKWPVRGEITSNFGERVHPVSGNEANHMGLDIGADYGDTVVACSKGVVSEAGYDDNLGNYVKVKHSDSVVTVYGHMSKISVRPDEAVDSTIKIGEVGDTGMATGPHLHLEVRVNGVCMNPLDYMVPYSE